MDLEKESDVSNMSHAEKDRFATALFGEQLKLDYSLLSVADVISNAETLKRAGNEAYQRGVLFVKHTVGKNDMVKACKCYAQVM